MGAGTSKLSDVTALSDAEIKALGFRETEYETFVTGQVFLMNNKEIRRSRDYKAHISHFSSMRDYQYQRKHLRKALMYTFLRDPRYTKLLDRVRGFVDIICRNPELCRTAREELARTGQFQPTCVESVFKELERLYGIYETDRMAKSLVSRVGPVACPLGHHAGYFGADAYHPELQKRLARAERRPAQSSKKIAVTLSSSSKEAGGGSGSDSDLSRSSKSSNKGATAAASQKGRAPGSPNASKKKPIANPSSSSKGVGNSVLSDNDSLTTISTKGTLPTAGASSSKTKMAIMMNTSERLVADFKVVCRICDQNVRQGYHCTYCDYNVCSKCAPMYCTEGHICKLWTNPEAELACSVCSAGPLMGGYHCNECMDFDLCDMCSYRDPRKYIQSIILKERAELVEWIRSRVNASETAYNAMKYHATDVTDDPCPTTLYHFNSLKYYRDCKKQIEWEVLFDILKQQIKALRQAYLVDMEYCQTVLRNALRPIVFTEDEKVRLEDCIRVFERARSEHERCKTVVGCPLGHAMSSYDRVPDTYRVSPEKKIKNVLDDDFDAPEIDEESVAEDPFVGCSLCHRIAHDGYHCSLCEFELCMTCKTMHCDKGHSQGMWTVPEAAGATCHYCGKENITSGYHCNACGTDMCDFCTRVEKRQERKVIIEKEIKAMMEYMIENRRNSDVARFYQWRKLNYVVSEGYLYEYLCEMRTAFYRAKKQVKYKELILEMKQLRKEIIEKLPRHLCKASADEQLEVPLYYFDSKKEAVAERNRLKAILDANLQMKTVRGRSGCVVACPQGHGMIPTLTRPRLAAEDESDSQSVASSESGHSSSKGSVSALSSKKSMLASMVKAQEKAKAKLEPRPADPNERRCKTCFDNPAGGNICLLCDYELCKPCSTLNCRAGHECVMWTLPEAYGLTCDVCKYPDLKAGYRCGECKTDMCDSCTQVDSRNSLKLGPRKEVKKLVLQLEMLRERSEIAAFYYSRNVSDKEMSYARTMTQLCAELRDLRSAKEQAEMELQHKIRQQSLISYAYTSSDL